MNKKLIAIFLILTLLIPSFSIANVGFSFDYTIDNGNITITVQGQQEKLVSITISDNNRKYYINQAKINSNGITQFKTKLDKGKQYNCTLNIDGQKISKHIFVEGQEIDPDNPKPGNPEIAYIYIQGYKGTILGKTKVEIEKGETVLSLTKKILNDKNISYEDYSGYIASIAGQGEKDKGPESGWMYSINGEFPKIGAGCVDVRNGDYIKWLYTTDLGKDIGNPLEEETNEKQNPIDKAYDIINNENATQNEIIQAIQEALKYYKAQTKNVKTQDINEILDNGNKISQILSQASKKANTQKLIIQILDTSIETTKYIQNLTNKQIQQDTIQKIVQITRNNMGIALNSINKIKNNKTKIEKSIEDIIETSSKIEKELSKNISTSNKISQKIVGINLIETSKNNNSITLPYILLQKSIKKDVDKINIISKLASFEITPDFLGTDIKQDVNINIKKSLNTTIEFKLGKNKISQFEKPIKITLPYKEKVTNKQNLTVILIKEDGTKQPIGGVYDETTKTIKFLTNKHGKFTIQELTKQFKDLDKYQWAKQDIESMAAKGIINGKIQNTFNPSENITRAEFVTLISRMLKYNQNQHDQLPFKDVPKDKWYYSSVLAVYQNGLVKGKTSTAFDPEGNITRQEMAKIIGNILQNNSYKKQNKSKLDIFEDSQSIASWAKEGSAITVHNKIINGNNSKFMPKQKATRAQTAVMLHRLYELILD